MADLKPTGGDLYTEYRNTLPGMSVEQTKQIEVAIKAGNFLEAASMVQTFKNLSGIDFNIAVTGESGSGKSSLVNAIRGLEDEDKGAAETRVMEMTKAPVPYCHPTCPIMIVWDLPSIGTPDFRPDTYLKEVNFSRYNVFIIIASERSRFCHTKLAREIKKMGKKFFFVRSKVDLDLYNEESKESFNEERTLEKIRKDCVNNLSRVGVSSPQVFLVSSREFQKYDSPQLQKALLKEFYNHKMEMFRATEATRDSGIMEDSNTHWDGFFSKWSSKLPGLSEEETEKFQTAVKAGNFSEAMSVVKMSDDMLRNTTLNIAITGNSGSGKSSFINAIRSLNDDDRGAAETGVTETTKDPTAYPHPIHPNVIVWDLPGIGTTKYPAKTYLTDVNVYRYDFFIIVAAGRFTEADTKLAKEINSMEKKFYFVRTKVDVDLANEQKKKDFKEEKTLAAIRSDCLEQLQKAGIISPQVFLVSRWDFHKYDSPLLQETFANDLNIHKRHVLICALPSTSEEILKEKQKALQEQIWKQALKSCALAAVPLPFLSVKCDVDILVENMREYCKSFGLDDDSIESLAKQVRMSADELKCVIKSPLAKDITREEALKRLREATGEPMMRVKSFISLIPLIGTGIAAKKSYSVTSEVLLRFLDEVAEDAQRVLKKALEGAGNNQ
ncbi:interferon-inducible GTPase 5-like [Trachemys scripta elegans]|uniref:interferon-inducible GTPase 5-like n=1 Tax=Trachemys scripta elegans TaxID=31138 RepID=UPI0015536C5F|nr:interferon-inducible GTPase 5-like [Trachemys scripta elegans]